MLSFKELVDWFHTKIYQHCNRGIAIAGLDEG